MGKLINLNNLDKLSKSLIARCKEFVDKEKARAIAKEHVLQSDINNVKDMFGGKSIRYVTQAEYDALTEEEKNTITYFITDAEKVVQVDIVDNILHLTTDKYQKTNMIDGTEILFPSVNKFTEIHLYFAAYSNMFISLPDNCKWRVEPDIEAGNSYEIIATYNTIEWLVNVIVYS